MERTFRESMMISRGDLSSFVTRPISGTILAIGVLVLILPIGGTKRLATMPDVPTAAEAGLPSYEAEIWWAWATTAGTPAAVINKLNTEVAAILRLPETARRFAVDSAEVDIRTPAEIRKMIPADLAKWEKVAKDAGMQKQ